MDRDDARFVADALDGRISGDRELLDRLAATSFVRLATSAVRVRALAADWPPAFIAAAEIESIAKYGSKVLDDPSPLQNLIIFVDKLRSIIDGTPPPNRAARRAAIAKLPRADRIAVDSAAFPG